MSLSSGHTLMWYLYWITCHPVLCYLLHVHIGLYSASILDFKMPEAKLKSYDYLLAATKFWLKRHILKGMVLGCSTDVVIKIQAEFSRVSMWYFQEA